MIEEHVRNRLMRFKNLVFDAYPGFVQQVILFGSEARGNAHEYSDIDVLVVTDHDDWRKGDEIRTIGYHLDLCEDSRLSIQVVAREHMDMLKETQSHFMRNVEGEGILV